LDLLAAQNSAVDVLYARKRVVSTHGVVRRGTPADYQRCEGHAGELTHVAAVATY